MKTGPRPSPLRLRRLVRGLRLRDVEKATGINDVVLSQIERGELPLTGGRLERLAGFYGEAGETHCSGTLSHLQAITSEIKSAPVGRSPNRDDVTLPPLQVGQHPIGVWLPLPENLLETRLG